MVENTNNYKRELEEKKKKQQEAHLQLSKKRLIESIERKFNTANIGILALIEKHFGHLWGYNQQRRLTEDEREMANIWSILRAEILDHGNHQKRGAINEISEYTLNWEKYRITFLPVSLIGKNDKNDDSNDKDK